MRWGQGRRQRRTGTGTVTELPGAPFRAKPGRFVPQCPQRHRPWPPPGARGRLLTPEQPPARGRTPPCHPDRGLGPQTGLGARLSPPGSPQAPQHRAGQGRRGCAPRGLGAWAAPRAAPPCSGVPLSRAFVCGTIWGSGAATGAARRPRSAPGGRGGHPQSPGEPPQGRGPRAMGLRPDLVVTASPPGMCPRRHRPDGRGLGSPGGMGGAGRGG